MRTGTRKFDEQTGQIYSEITVAIKAGDDRGWDRTERVIVGPSYRDINDYDDYEGYMKNWREFRNTVGTGYYRNYLDSVKNSKVKGQKGARSLQDAAIECILQNISDITLEGIECLPVQIIRRLWHAVNKRCTVCFNTWKIFATVLHQASDIPTLELLRFRHIIQNPISPLLVYTSPLTCNSFKFLTSLRITTPFPVPDLCALSSIKNLGILEIINTSYASGIDVNDRVVRAWNTAALNEGAFPVLRTLKLWGYRELTNHSLSFLNDFPSLAIYDVSNCGFSSDAELRGWTVIKFHDVLQHLDEQCLKKVSLLKTQNTDPNLFGIIYSPPLWDSSGIETIPRAEVKNFLAQREHPTPLTKASKEQKVLDTETISPHIRKQKACKTLMSKSYPTQAPEAWDYRAYNIFTRIGELREDSDLAKAGVAIGEQAVANQQLVNSVPMVSLCVGPIHYSISTVKLDALVFVRIQIPEKKTLKAKEKPSSQSGTKAQSSKRPSYRVNKTKKRNLDDLLSSFM